MGEMIQKPDTNPIIVAALNWFVLGGLGYYLMGQKKKAMIAWVVTIILSIVTCGSLWWIWTAICSYDAYVLGQKLQAGESIGENQNGLDFLNAIFKD